MSNAWTNTPSEPRRTKNYKEKIAVVRVVGKIAKWSLMVKNVLPDNCTHDRPQPGDRFRAASTIWLPSESAILTLSHSTAQEEEAILTTGKQTKRFAKRLDELDGVFSFLDTCLADVAISADQVFTVRLAVEEIFANMVKHNEPGANAVTLSLDCDSSTLKVELTDHGVKPFEIPDPNAADMDESARDGKTSGRGIFLIRQMVDQLEYEYRNGDSVVRLSIKIGSPHA